MLFAKNKKIFVSPVLIDNENKITAKAINGETVFDLQAITEKQLQNQDKITEFILNLIENEL